jgi:multicomponent Na+:H+ antiporter subunit D
MPPALWLVALPVGTIPVVYVLRRIKLGAVVAALMAFLSAWLAMVLPTGVVLNLLGRSIELDHLSQITLALVFGVTAVLFLIPLFSPATGRTTHGGIKKGVERIFYPVGLTVLALFVAASLSRHLGITAIFIEAAAILTVVIIQGQRLDSIRASQRFLTLMSLATPLFLLAAWRIDLYQLSEGQIPDRDLQQIVFFVSLGFALWLGVFPFHGWVTTTAAESSPATAAFVLTIFPILAFSNLIQLTIDWPWLVDSSQLVMAIIIAGVFTAFAGGILASVQRGFAELMGYAALFGFGGQAAIITIFVALTIRAVALALIAASTSAIRLLVAGDGFAQMQGLARSVPVAITGLTVGGLTLAGAPLTAGFATHWQLLNSMTEINSTWSLLLVLAGLGVSIGYLRGLRATLYTAEPAKNQKERPRKAALTFQEPSLLLVMIIVLIVVCIGLGLFPSLLIKPLQQLTAGISIPIP